MPNNISRIGLLKTLLLGCALMVAACGALPRGAGLQREVLAHSEDTVETTTANAPLDGQPALPSEFAVEPITRDSLTRYANWPNVGEHGKDWIQRVAQPNTRIIAPGDTVAITLWNTEENSLLTAPGQRFVNLPANRVSPAGSVFLPYIGQIKISGMSPDEARGAIEKNYLNVTPSAQVQLELLEGRQSTISMIGGVVRPGPYPLPDQDVTLLDVLAEAGGASPALINPQIRLQRGERIYGISLDRLLADTAQNTTLRGGDRIFVEQDSRYFLSLGAAGSQAQHRFPQEHLTALDALSIIGGLSADRANAQGILILRRYADKSVRGDGSGPRHIRTIFTIDLTRADGLFSAGEFRIRPGDLIYATESPLIGTRNVFAVIGSVFGLANQVSAIN